MTEVTGARERNTMANMESAIKMACIQALKALGANYKGMSCFLYNWQGSSVKTEEQDKKAA